MLDQYSFLKDELALQEIRKHQWLEGEKKGHAVGFATAALDSRSVFCAPDIPWLGDWVGYLEAAQWAHDNYPKLLKVHPGLTFAGINRFLSYFDTMNMDNYLDNEFGTAQRVKTRVRWYGNLFGEIQEPVLQLKMKNGIVGSKITFPLVSFTLDKTFSSSLFKTIIESSIIPPLVK